MTATATLAAPRSQQEWFASWFDSPHYHRLYVHRDQGEAAAFVDRLIRSTRAPATAPQCSTWDAGADGIPVAWPPHGFRVTGIDLSAGSLARARRGPGRTSASSSRTCAARSARERSIYVLSLFTSFGYFDDQMDHMTVIHNIARSLKPGGTVVLDYLNVDHVQKHSLPAKPSNATAFATPWRAGATVDAFFKRITIDDGFGTPPLEHVERVAKLTSGIFSECSPCAACASRRPTAITNWAASMPRPRRD